MPAGGMRMKQAVWYSALMVLLSYVAVLAWAGAAMAPSEGEPAKPSEEGPAEVTAADSQVLLRLKTEAGVQELDLQTYLLGVVCGEMPLSFADAALQAQAVASRTFTLYHRGDSKHPEADVCAEAGCCQAWKSEAELEQTFGDQWTMYRSKALDAILATDGQVLTRDGALINAVFFSCSGGMTESAAAVWGAEVPYLQPVASPGEEIASVYSGQTTVDLMQFRETLSRENAAVDLTGNPSAWFGAVTESPGGGVARMQIGGVWFDGTRLRSLFGLNSTCFTVAVGEEHITFYTRGKGHRVGMSQYGAQAMALEGADCAQIVTHYYTGVSVTDYMAS